LEKSSANWQVVHVDSPGMSLVTGSMVALKESFHNVNDVERVMREEVDLHRRRFDEHVGKVPSLGLPAGRAALARAASIESG
jgi:hypothetical protein